MPAPQRSQPSARGVVRAGIGGWTYPPWRGEFYPAGLPHSRELAYASRQLTSIEINATFYRAQTPATFAKWARETPDGFVFSLKAPRVATYRRLLAEAGPSVERFVQSGIAELGDRLGPILWQLPPTKAFDDADLGRFLELLPRELGGLRLRHALEVRHPSFMTAGLVRLLRRLDVALVHAEHESYPSVADVTGGFVYCRLQKGRDDIPTGYSAAELGRWAKRALAWAEGRTPPGLDLVLPSEPAAELPRDVFVYFIHEGKLRAPAAAQALIGRLTG